MVDVPFIAMFGYRRVKVIASRSFDIKEDLTQQPERTGGYQRLPTRQSASYKLVYKTQLSVDMIFTMNLI